MKNILEEYKDYIKKSNNMYIPVNCKYRHKYVKLTNKLDIVFVEDTVSVDSCAVMYVECGSNNDPKDTNGLAHFLEHLLFMGSTKYPEVDKYFKQINFNNGSSNAYTARDHTQYHFTIANNMFLKTLDIFSRFFIDPLFDVKYVEKEVNAVDSEHNKNIGSDTWRIRNVTLKLMVDGVNSSFGTGNTKTLLGNKSPKQLREQVVKFYETFYSSHKMKLYISHNNIDEIIVKVSDMFKDVILREETYFENVPLVNIYKNKYELLKIKTLGNNKFLYLNWLVDGTNIYDNNMNKSSFQIIGNILGNENKGSIYDYLESKKLINSLTYTINDKYDKKTKIVIVMNLTDKGFKKWKYIVYSINNYIKNIYELDCYDKFFNEYKKMTMYSIQTYETSSGSLLCFKYSDIYNITNIDIEYLPISSLLYGYDKRHYDKTLLSMNMKNVKVILTSDVFDETLSSIDEFYGTEYSITIKKIKDKKNKFNKLSPELNRYLSTDLKLMKIIDKNSSDNYLQIDSSSKHRYYIKNKNPYKTYLFYGQVCIDIENDMEQSHFNLLMSLYIAYIDKINNTTIYMMNNAGINISVYNEMKKIFISFSGNAKNMDKYFKEVIGWYFNKHKSFNQKKFNDIYDVAKKNLKNWELKEPYVIIEQLFKKHVNKDNCLLPNQYLHILDKIKNFDNITDYFNKGKIIGIFGGSVKMEIINSIIETLNNYVSYYDKTNIKQNIDLSKSLSITKSLNPVNKDNAICYGIYTGKIEEKYDGKKNNNKMYPALVMIISFLHDKFFNIIRTEKQLGYIAYCSLLNVSTIYGVKEMFIIFTIQSKYDNLREHIEDFLKNDIISSLTDEEFNNMKTQMINSYLEETNTMSNDIAIKFSHMMVTDNLEADRYKLYVKYLKKLEKKQFIKIYENICKNQRIIININT